MPCTRPTSDAVSASTTPGAPNRSPCPSADCRSSVNGFAGYQRKHDLGQSSEHLTGFADFGNGRRPVIDGTIHRIVQPLEVAVSQDFPLKLSPSVILSIAIGRPHRHADELSDFVPAAHDTHADAFAGTSEDAWLHLLGVDRIQSGFIGERLLPFWSMSNTLISWPVVFRCCRRQEVDRDRLTLS